MTTTTLDRIIVLPFSSSCGAVSQKFGYSINAFGNDGKTNLVNNYNKTTIKVRDPYVSWKYFQDDPIAPYKNGTYSGCFGTRIAFPGAPTYPNEIEDDVKLKLLSNIRGHNFSPLVSAAESKKTAALIETTATTLANVINNIKKGRIDRAAKLLKIRTPRVKRDVSDPAFQAWLQMKYGWMPLLMEVREAAKALAKSHLPPRKIFKAISVRSYTHINNSNGLRGSYSNNLSCVWKVALSRDISNTETLQLTNPLHVVWELTPWSFVVDWFLPIGNYIEAKETALQIQGNVLYGVITKKLTESDFVYGQKDYFISGAYERSTFKFSRVRNDNLSVSLPTFKIPRIDSNRVFTSLALLSTVFKR